MHTLRKTLQGKSLHELNTMSKFVTHVGSCLVNVTKAQPGG